MKIKLALLLALIGSASLIAQEAKPEAPKGDAPAKKAEGKGDKGGKKGPQRPESVDEATWKKFLDAQKAAQNDDAVKAAKAKVKPVTKDSTKEEKDAAQEANKAVMEATKAAVLKADASLESVFKALEEARAKGKGKGDKGGKGAKKGEGEGKKPEAK
jgi:hypothetical protein